MRAIAKKIRDEHGESLVETAASLLVVSFAMLMLAGAIVTSGRLNADADETASMAAVVSESYEPASATVTMTYGMASGGSAGDAGGGASESVASSATADVKLYKAGDLYYYELQDGSAIS